MASRDTNPPRRVGLIRAGTEDGMAAQALRLREAGCAEIRRLGPPASWPDFDFLCAGDAVVVASLDVLGPPLRGAVARVQELLDRGVFLTTLDEGLRVTPAGGDPQSAVFAALGGCMRVWEQRRTEARGRTLRSRQGRAGRRPKLAADDGDRVLALLGAPGAKVPEVARFLGVGRTTLYRFLQGIGHAAGQERPGARRFSPSLG